MHRLFRSHVQGAPAGGSGDANREAGLEALRAQFDRLSMVCQALWTLLRDKTELTEEDLIARVHDVDLTDGVLDGKVRRVASECTACGRVVAARHLLCLYCGAPNEGQDVFG